MIDWIRNWLVTLFGIGSLVVTPTPMPLNAPTPTIEQQMAKMPREYGEVKLPKFEKQTFNNCGPTTLAMVLAYFGISASAYDLGQQVRPYQVAGGNNDDKTVFATEYAQWAQKYGLKAIVRPNGSIDLLKKLVANGLPVTVKTLLHDNDDIAHFRIIRGWDERKQSLLQDDSYEGKNKWFKYEQFDELWEPFGRGYIIVYRPDQEELVKSIVGIDWDEQVAWEHAAESATGFSLVVAKYHVGDYQDAVQLFEQLEASLPRRTMWYQIEPILAYQHLGNFERVMQLTNKLLSDGNRAYSELYQIRGEMYLAIGDKDAAKKEFEQAVYYNKNYQPAINSLSNL